MCVWAPGLLLPNSPGLARRRSSIDVPPSPPHCAPIYWRGFRDGVMQVGWKSRPATRRAAAGRGQANGRGDPSVGEQGRAGATAGRTRRMWFRFVLRALHVWLCA